jgi:hypothetical protein
MTSGEEQRPPAAKRQSAKTATSQEQALAAAPTADQAASPEGVKSTRRLPGFFSSVGRPQQQDAARPELERGKMRLWRAQLRKSAAGESGEQSAKPVAGQKEAAAGGRKAAAPARSQGQSAARTGASGGMQPRHFLGLFIYVIVAFLIQAPIYAGIQALRLEVVVWQFSIGSFPVVISTSTLVYIAAIIAVLVILQRFDLLFLARRPPSSKTGSSSQKAQSGSKGARASTKTSGGEHDDLYEDYRDLRRYLRRRARKR